jgi:hypothetical protein
VIKGLRVETNFCHSVARLHRKAAGTPLRLMHTMQGPATDSGRK